MASLRIVVVVNPQSQNGALGRRWSEIAGEVRREIGGFEDALTRAPGDATRLAREAVRAGAELVVAIGGDGTINEVVNGLFDGDRPIERPPDSGGGRPRLGVLPFGTGGDFRKSIDVPTDIASAARLLREGHPRTIDVGHLRYTTEDGATETRIFVNIASLGISGLVDQFANRSTKAFGGRISFGLATLRASLRYQNRRVRLVFDGDEAGGVDRNVNTVAVANGRYFGGGMFIAPNAELDDGQFDVVTIGDISKFDMLRNSPRLYRGTHLTMDQVEARRAREVTATSLDRQPVLIDCDGEAPGRLPATFRLLPKALTVMVPASPSGPPGPSGVSSS